MRSIISPQSIYAMWYQWIGIQKQFKAHLKEQICKNHQENLEREVLHRTWPHCKDALQQRCQRRQAGTTCPTTSNRSYNALPLEKILHPTEEVQNTRDGHTFSTCKTKPAHLQTCSFLQKAFTDRWKWVGKGSCTCKPKQWFTYDQGWSLVWGPSAVSSANDKNNLSK